MPSVRSSSPLLFWADAWCSLVRELDPWGLEFDEAAACDKHINTLVDSCHDVSWRDTHKHTHTHTQTQAVNSARKRGGPHAAT